MGISLGLLACAVGVWLGLFANRTRAVAAAGAVLAGALWSVAYAVIDRLTGSGIDASVTYHLQAGLDGAGLADFRGLAALAALGVLASVMAAVAAFRLMRAGTVPPPNAAVRGVAGLALVLGAFGLHPATGDLARLVAHARQATVATGPAPPGLVTVDQAEFTGARRNVVVLYLESVERTYFDEARFPGLMPHLTALQDEAVSFTDLTEVEESGWTVAGMVASQCGLPLVGSGAGMDRFLPGATCLGDLLADAGYDLAYVGGADTGFAGKGSFYASHGFASVEGRAELEPLLDDPLYVNDWGLYDDSLYPQALRRFQKLAAGDRPFGLVVLTLDTHHPFGFPSRSCADRPYGDGANPLLNAVHCADWLAAEFIATLRRDPAFGDTVIVVLSDHLAMPNLAQEQLAAGPRRNLMLVLAPGLAPARIDRPGTTLDVGPTLLGLLGAPTDGLGYGRDLLGDGPTLRTGEPGLEALIDAGRGHLAALWSYPQVTAGLSVDIAAAEAVLGDRRVKIPALFHLDAALAVTGIDFQADDDLTLVERVAALPPDQQFVWVDACARTELVALGPAPEGSEVCVLAGRLSSRDLLQFPAPDGVRIPPETLSAAFARPASETALHPDLLATLARRRLFGTTSILNYSAPNGLAGAAMLRSAGYQSGGSWAMTPAQGDRVPLVRGLTLLGLAPGTAPVKLGHVDTCGYGGRLPDEVPLETGFQAVIDSLRGRFGAFAIVAHDSVLCDGLDPGLEALFQGTGLTTWRGLSYEEPYIAVITGNGLVKEFTGPPRSALGVELVDVMRPARSDTQRQLDWLPRILRADGAFGGPVAGQPYADATLIAFVLHGSPGQDPACLPVAPAPEPAADGSLPCTADTLANWLRGHPAVRVVPEVTGDALDTYSRFAAAYPDLQNRLVPLIRHPDEYDRVRDLGYTDVILALDQPPGDEAAFLSRLATLDLLGLSMPISLVESGLARRARATTGVLTWAREVNTRAALDAALAAGAAEVVTDRLLPRPSLRFEAVSAAYGAGESFLRRLDGSLLALPRGISLLQLSADPALLASLDPCGELDTGVAPDPTAFRQTLTAALAQGRALAVMVHDSAYCAEYALAPLFAGTPLRLAPTLGFRQPYVGLIRADGGVLEFTSAEGTRLREVLAVEVAP